MARQQRERRQRPAALLLMLLLLGCLSFNPICCFLKGAPGAPSTLRGPLPHVVVWLRHRGPRESSSGLGPLGYISDSSSNSSSSRSEQRECPRCVLLRPKKAASPVVAGWTEALEALGASPAGSLQSPVPLGGRPSLMAGARQAALDTVIDVLTVEVGIAPETQRALGLRRSAQKRHLFLPVSLLGPLAVFKEAEPRGSSKGPAPVCCEGNEGAPLRSSLLGALKEAACRVADWEGVVGVVAPPLLTARIETAETKPPGANQLASQLASQVEPEQLASKRTPGKADVSSDEASCWTSVPLTSEKETLRVLSEHYGPLLAQYYLQRQSLNGTSTSCCCSSNNNEDTLSCTSRSSSCCTGDERARTLRILRLPRGPRLSLHLHLDPTASSLCTEETFLKAPPAPPPLTEAEPLEGPLRGAVDAYPPYQLVSLYKFFRVGAPDVLAGLLRALWGPRGVLGRAYVAFEGLNAQLAVPAPVLSSLLAELREVPGLGGGPQMTVDCSIPFEAYWRRPPFDALHVRPRQQVLRDGFDRALNWDDCGEEVDPAVWHRKLKEALQQQQQQQRHQHQHQQQQQQQRQQQGRKVVVLDMRNASEFAVGHFKGAECIDTPTFADSFLPGGPLEAALRRTGVRVAQRGASSSDGLSPSSSSSSSSNQDVEVMMYCTGGIRCVKAGAFVKQVLGFPRVTRLRGGILAYKNFIRGLARHEAEGAHPMGASQHLSSETQPAAESLQTEACAIVARESPAAVAAAPAASGGEESLFIGSNYVFDHRMCQEVTRDLLASCSLCEGPTGRLVNCSRRQCGLRVALCASCCSTKGTYCSPACAEKGAQEAEREIHAQQQRRMQATHTHKRLVQQRGLWALRAQQLLEVLKQSAAADSEGASSHRGPSSSASAAGESRPAAVLGGSPAALEGTPPPPAGQNPWERAHQVATAASSPSLQQGQLLLQAQQEAERLTGVREEGAQFWSGHLQSRVLSAISRIKKPQSILDIGAFVGISCACSSGWLLRLPPLLRCCFVLLLLLVRMPLTVGLVACACSTGSCAPLLSLSALHLRVAAALSLAEGLPLQDAAHATKPRLIAIERDPRAASVARRLIARSPWSPLVQMVEADAMEVLRCFVAAAKTASEGSSASLTCTTSSGCVLPCMPSGGFDLIYLDAEKRKYSDYLGLILHPQGPLLARGGVLVVDNTLWRKGQWPLRENERPIGEGARPPTGRCSKDTHEKGSSSKLRRWARVGEAMEKFRETLRRDPRISHVSFLFDAASWLASKRGASNRVIERSQAPIALTVCVVVCKRRK
ncbi:hypothetical protein ACSSS7_006989 [Eimeria intestinalis]